jgi:hypothetical protein
MRLALHCSTPHAVLCAILYCLGGYMFMTNIHAFFLFSFSCSHSSDHLQFQHFQVPCFLSILHYLTHRSVTFSAVSDLTTSHKAVTSSYSTSNIAALHCHCNTPAPFWLPVLLPLHQYLAPRLLYCLFFLDWLHLTVKPTWSCEMSGATHPRM